MDTNKLPMDSYIQGELLYEINSATLKLRQMLKATYPILPAQDLIGELPMVLNENNLNVLVMRIISHTHWSTKEKLASEVDEYASRVAQIYIETNSAEGQDVQKAIRMFCEAIVYMRHNGLSIIMKLRKAEMQVLIAKAAAYSAGELEPSNNGVFECGESDVYANEHDIGEKYAENRKLADLYRAIDEHSKMR